MKTRIIMLLVLLVFTSCVKSTYLPFATTNRQGKLPAKRNKVVKNNT